MRAPTGASFCARHSRAVVMGSTRVQIARPADFGLAFDLGVQIPTGQANFIGDEGVIVDPRLLWRDASAAAASLRRSAYLTQDIYVCDYSRGRRAMLVSGRRDDSPSASQQWRAP